MTAIDRTGTFRGHVEEYGMKEFDGGSISAPTFGFYEVDGTWGVEGHGVDPDIVVDNDPAREFRGEDQQLDKAIEVILEELKTKGQALPPPPPGPIKR